MSAATDYIQLTHAASEIDGTIDEVYAARGSYGNLSGRIASKQDKLTEAQQAAVDSGITAAKLAADEAALSGKQDALTTAQLAAANSGITAEKLTADEAALAEVVDAGAKNLSTVSSGMISNTGGGFPIQTTPITVSIGTYIVSFRFSGNATRGSVQFRSGSTTIDSLTFNMAPLMFVQIEITSDTIDNFNLYSNGTATISEFMICTAEDYAVSPKFVPYRPSWQEMWEMIQALQNGTRSAPALAMAEPEEIKEPETGEEEQR